jgi:two-component system, NarL family, sensor histidine kinase BarA
MSYRAFKKLLGETSLERKCRWLLGAGVLLLMTGSFWVYARQTEDLAYEQLETTGRALLTPILARQHVNGDIGDALDGFQTTQERNWPQQFKGYSY